MWVESQSLPPLRVLGPLWSCLFGSLFYLRFCPPPPMLVHALVTFFNERLSEESGPNQKTTIGEVLRFIGYLFAFCFAHGTPVEDMWQDEPRQGDILPPPAIWAGTA